jgi:hypothetical protein
MHSATAQFLAKGGLDEGEARCWYPSTTTEVFDLYRDARARGRRVTLVGAQKSFGGHFLCPPGAEACDVTGLGRASELVERTANGSAIWVRVAAGVTFKQLLGEFPGYRPENPPTSDGISIGGALASCSHNMAGYFADGVRAFRLLAANGQSYRCSPDGTELERALYEFAPGAFGAFGVMTDIELRLRAVPADLSIQVEVLSRGRVADSRCLEELFRAADDPKHEPGHGMFLYGREDRYALLADSFVTGSGRRPRARMLLTADRPRLHAALQGLSNRYPSLARRIALSAFRPGRLFSADWYGFLFFQRSYDTAHEILSSPSPLFAALRGLGVDPRLTVCHQTWCFPREQATEFMRLYWSTMKRYPGIERRAEQQDMVALRPCRWPAHASWGNRHGSALLTPSLAVRRGSSEHARAEAFFRELSRVAFAQNPRFKLMLLKQAACDDGLLREMHGPYVARLRELKRHVDPDRLISSKLLERLQPS